MFETTVAELDDALYDRIMAFANEGNALYDNKDFAGALGRFKQALALVPEPLEDWEASLWCLVSIGDCLFLLGRFQEAHAYLTRSMRCEGALGNPFIHLRLGQVQYELGNVERAKDELARAYMGGGAEEFAEENPKYYNFLRQFMKGL